MARRWLVGDTVISLESILLNQFAYPLDLDYFLRFCKIQHNEENVQCWREMSQWKKEFSTQDQITNISSADNIVIRYIGSNATVAQVNLPSVMEKKLFEGQKSGQHGETSEFFDEALHEIESIIYQDLFPRFIRAVECKLDHERSKALALWCFHLSDVHGFSGFFHFPNVINEAESRIHQYLASLLMIIFLLIGWFTPYWYVYIYIAYGYLVRVLAGPRLCPNAWLVLFVLAPLVHKYRLLDGELLPSPPKRFAQFVGLIFATTYCVLMYLSYPLPARIISIVHISVALLAGCTGFCLGCYCYTLMIRSERYVHVPIAPIVEV